MIGTSPQTFEPLPWQIAPWRDRGPVLLFTGSAGGGKSRLAAEKLHAFCLKYPGSMALMVRKTRESMVNSTVLMMDRLIIGQTDQVRHKPTAHRFEYTNGSILAYGGMADEAQREQVRSIGQTGGLDIAWMEEATRFEESDFNELPPRMRGQAAPWRQIILTTNPAGPRHWINLRLILSRGAKVYYSRAADNTYNPADYATSLDSLTGVQRKRLRDGLWVQAEGVVFPEWNPEIHVLQPFTIPSDWRRFRSVDFGYTNPFCCQWWAQDNDGRMYLYRELYQTGRTVATLAEQIKAYSAGEACEFTTTDWDAEDRATLEECGIPTQQAIKDISPGLQAIRDRLKPGPDGRPSLFIVSGATVRTDPALEDAHKPTSTQSEMGDYVWAIKPEDKQAPETPVKLHDHGIDAMRYAVMAAKDSGPTVEYTTLGGLL